MFSDKNSTLSERDSVLILLEEYRVLNNLLQTRLGVMDRRLPLTTGALGGLLCSVPVMPRTSMLLALVGLPAALVWLVTTTTDQARSKEDHLRRIDEIERLVNHLAGEQLLSFQSRHPNRRQAVSGRSGRGTVDSMCMASLVMVLACCSLAQSMSESLGLIVLAYHAYAAVAATALTKPSIHLRHYRYAKPPPGPAPPFGTLGSKKPASGA